MGSDEVTKGSEKISNRKIRIIRRIQKSTLKDQDGRKEKIYWDEEINWCWIKGGNRKIEENCSCQEKINRGWISGKIKVACTQVRKDILNWIKIPLAIYD